MDFYNETPSTSRLSPQSRLDDFHEEGLGTDQDSSLDQSTCGKTNHSRIDDISNRVQDLVAKINEHRTNDEKVMDSFQETLLNKVTEDCQQMKERLYAVYEDNSHDMQAKLLELSEILESCSKLNDELLGASQALVDLRQGLGLSHTPEQ